MKENILHIKNMVCNRCIMAVEDLLKKHKINFKNVELGKVYLNIEKNQIPLDVFSKDLLSIGFELLQDEKSRLVAEIKTAIVEWVHYKNKANHKNFSEFISNKLNKDYSVLTTVFSNEAGITIEKYLILQKIERAKELLVYQQMNISEISYLLDYSSIQHFSSQFKKITGYTPSQFRKLENNSRQTLDEI